MNPTAIHGSFKIERRYPAKIARVFAAWTDPALKAQWFIGPPQTWTALERTLDVRPGGVEILRGTFGGGRETKFVARYHQVAEGQRLVYTYDMHHGGAHLSVSLATVEFFEEQGGTRLVFTEQAVFLDGSDGAASREVGTAAHLDRIGEVLRAVA